MKERPIIFSSEMVRAILNGRKTQTRRVIKGLITPTPDFEYCFHATNKESWEVGYDHRNGTGEPLRYIKCPYGQPGDRLWVKEAWQDEFNYGKEKHKTIYRATDRGIVFGGLELISIKWKSPRFMPRLASRITLEIVSIRVERVQEISEEDAIAEGISKEAFPIDGLYFATQLYAEVWDSLNAKRGYGWDQNPWVWVIEFKRLGEGVEK